jgi:hypothetical protein
MLNNSNYIDRQGGVDSYEKGIVVAVSMRPTVRASWGMGITTLYTFGDILLGRGDWSDFGFRKEPL